MAARSKTWVHNRVCNDSPGLAGPETTTGARTSLRMMSFNIWGGGANERLGTEATAAAIEASGADVVGVQETRREGDDEDRSLTGASCAPALARALRFHCYEQPVGDYPLCSSAIFSRYPMVEVSPRSLGVKLDVGGAPVWVFNVHLYEGHAGMADLQSGKLAGEAGVTEALRTTDEKHGPQLQVLFDDMGIATDGGDADAVFLTGDFNEPSWLDWTDAAFDAGRNAAAAAWPTTSRLAESGFVDTYRACWPDPLAQPGYTWPAPFAAPPAHEAHLERIDYVFAWGEQLVVSRSTVLSAAPGHRWPSDHMAVLSDVSFRIAAR